jgi:hypothetical protein
MAPRYFILFEYAAALQGYKVHLTNLRVGQLTCYRLYAVAPCIPRSFAAQVAPQPFDLGE